jgi:lysophospholipase L1-like esterase
MKGLLVTVILACGCLAGPCAFADTQTPDPGRFPEEIEAFVAWDSKNAVPDRPILFVGSSSIRLWKTAEAFPGKPVINRGFGGSELWDVLFYYDRVVRPYAPVQIFLYEGDNDIAGGKTPEQVLEDFVTFADRVETDFPGTELVFISVKPSRLRWDFWPQMQQANALVRAYTDQHAHLEYADLATVLLDDAGQPKDVYLDDDLHLNERGYELWTQALAPYLVAGQAAASNE